MIRINLLPIKRKKKVQPLPAVFIYGAGALVIIFIVLGVLFLNLTSKISRMKDDKAKKEVALIELREKIKEVENYEKDNEAYRKKNDIIEQLKKNQNAPLRLLDEVSAQLPKGVWLTSLTSKADAVDIKGYAFTNSDLVGYVQNLKSSQYLTDVELLESKQAKVGDVFLYEFKLIFRIKV
jgi:type IV pilus assembly protein PilN